MLRLVAILVVLVGCKERNSQFCLNQDNQNDPACMVDGPPVTPCSSNAECTAPTAVCDTVDTMSCVECTAAEDDACVGTEPVCGADHSCRGCSAHTECPSNVCLPTGACADETTVAYVQAGEVGTTCDKASPCPTMTLGIATGRDFVKVNTGTVNDVTTTAIARAVTILADPGASINVVADDVPVLSVATGAADVKIFDLTITGGTLGGGVGINLPTGGAPKLSLTRATLSSNAGGGITASAGSITVSQSTLSNNAGGGITVSAGSITVSQSTLSLNTGGGISVSGATTFDITNTFIFRNGDDNNSAFGGLNLGIAVAGTNRLAFNTIVDNEAAINSGGIICNVPTFTGPNNIIARNTLAGSAAGANANTSGACLYPTSKIQTDVVGLEFEDPEAPAPFVYTLKANSSAIDQALTSVPIDVDFEGDPRPGSSPEKDIGADER